MDTVRVIKDGYECDAGVVPEGWFAAVSVMHDFDSEYLAHFGRDAVAFKEGRAERDWSEAFASAPRRLILVSQMQGCDHEQTLTEAERIGGFAAVSGPEPAVAWTERDDGRWRLVLWTPNGAQTITQSGGMLRAPSIARLGGRIVIACEYERDGRGCVGVWTDSGRLISEAAGRRPKLAGSPQGEGLLLVEECRGPEDVILKGHRLTSEALIDDIPLPPAGDYNLNTDLICDPQKGRFYAVWESCPSWGYDERVGLYRDISLWMLEPGATAFRPGPGTSNGFLHIEPKAFLDWSMHNLTPINPRLLLVGGGPAVAFRRFRFTGQKCYGWDTFLMRWAGERWTEPARASRNSGHPDAAYTILGGANELLGFFPCCNQMPQRTFAEEAQAMAPRPTGYADHHRLEIVRFPAEETLPDVAIPQGKEAIYAIPPSLPEVALDPPPLANPPEGLGLVWGDLHAHSAYSKCMSPNDGLPQDVLRLQRDVLGCRVLCLSEHIEYMTNPEFTHVLDWVESEAGDGCIPLYAVEWAKNPAHHTNFYAIDRDVFDRLRALLLACDHLQPIYQRIKRELPPGSVVAIRHFHGIRGGDYGIDGPRMAETHDAELEWAMEAMQTRGNKMIGLSPTAPAFPGDSVNTGVVPLFPNSFLNAGAKVGLVGGSDHSRGKGPNRFCLTGFWVPVVTGKAVFEALRGRKTIAVANGKIAIYATLDGHPMGSSLSVAGEVRVKAQISSARTVRRACLMRDGELLPWAEVGSKSAVLELADDGATPGYHWYVLTVEADSIPQGPPILAHASPFFVEVE